MCARKADPPEVKARKEAAIKQAALKYFSEKGFHTATTSEITQAAGIAKGTLYWYFRTKEDLAFALVSDMLSAFLGVVQSMRDEGGPVIPRFQRLAEEVSALYLEEKDYCRLLWKFRADHHYVFSLDYQERVTRYYQDLLQALADMFNQGIKGGEFRKIDARHWAFILLGITEGLELEWLENEDEFDMDKAFREVMGILLEHLKKKKK
jgi:AcrR family transcriptional regulator